MLYINGLCSESVLKTLTSLFIHSKDYGDLEKNEN